MNAESQYYTVPSSCSMEIISHISPRRLCVVACRAKTFPFIPVSGKFLSYITVFHVSSNNVLPSKPSVGPPLGNFPCIFVSATVLLFKGSPLSSFHLLNHSNLPFLMTIAIGSTLASANISSFPVAVGSHQFRIAPSPSLSLTYAFRMLQFDIQYNIVYVQHRTK